MNKKTCCMHIVTYFFGLILSISAVFSHAEEVAYLGKDGWLFYKYENFSEADAPSIDKSISLIGQFSRAMESRGIQVYMAIVPVKIRIYNNFLNDPLPKYISDSYISIYKKLVENKVKVIDLNAPFEKYAEDPENSEYPLFLKHDTHWSAAGALLAAETIGNRLKSDPASSHVLDFIPKIDYQIQKKASKVRAKVGDLVAQLPASAPKQDIEMIQVIRYIAPADSANSLTGDTHKSIALVGSSYSAPWTTFPSAIRYSLQRDMADTFVPATQGSWQGMLAYLKDDSFKYNRPKILIWEIPERDMIAPPEYKYREARYQMKSNDWLEQALAAMK